MADGENGPQIGEWQRRLLMAVQPAGLAMLTLWCFWLLIAVVDGHIEGIGWVVAALGLVTSVLLVIAGAGYRKALRDAS